MKKNTDNKPVGTEIKEGQEGGPVNTTREGSDEKAYPRKSTKDVQYDNQAEFIDGDTNTQEKS